MTYSCNGWCRIWNIGHDAKWEINGWWRFSSYFLFDFMQFLLQLEAMKGNFKLLLNTVETLLLLYRSYTRFRSKKLWFFHQTYIWIGLGNCLYCRDCARSDDNRSYLSRKYSDLYLACPYNSNNSGIRAWNECVERNATRLFQSWAAKANIEYIRMLKLDSKSWNYYNIYSANNIKRGPVDHTRFLNNLVNKDRLYQ